MCRPKWIADHEKRDVGLLRASKNVIAFTLNQVSISDDDLPTVVSFLQMIS